MRSCPDIDPILPEQLDKVLERFYATFSFRIRLQSARIRRNRIFFNPLSMNTLRHPERKSVRTRWRAP